MNLVFKDFYALKVETEFYIGSGILRNKDLLSFPETENALLIIDHNVIDQDYFKTFIVLLKELYKEVAVMKNKEIEPTTITVNSMVESIKKRNIGVVFGAGGGSTLDIAKAVAVLLTNPGRAEDYQGMDKLLNPGILCITIPTVAGSGAELTPSAVLINTEKRFKGGINGRFVAPTRAILDPKATIKAPLSATMYSAFDAFVHALESHTCKLASPVVKMFASEALRILLRAIPDIVDDLENIKIREDLLLASEYAVIALMHSEPGPMASFGYQLAIRHGVPHGLANAIAISKTMEIQIEKGANYSFLYELLPEKSEARTIKDKSISAHRYVSEIIRKGKIPGNLKAYGFMPEHYEELAVFVDNVKKGFPTAMTEFNKQDLLNVLLSFYE